MENFLGHSLPLPLSNSNFCLVLVFSLKEADDVVRGFDRSNDLIDVRGMFSAPQFQAENRFAQYRQFIQLVQVGASNAVQIDTDGSSAASALTTLVTLQNVLASSL